MDKENPEWRKELEECLRAHVGQKVHIATLFELFVPKVPLQHATRCRTARTRQIEGVPIEKMKQEVIFSELVRYPLDWGNHPRGRNKRIEPEAEPVPCKRYCAGCRVEFFGKTRNRYCTQQCSARNRLVRRVEPVTDQVEQILANVEKLERFAGIIKAQLQKLHRQRTGKGNGKTQWLGYRESAG